MRPDSLMSIAWGPLTVNDLFTVLSYVSTWSLMAFVDCCTQCPSHILATEERFALFITLFFTYPKTEPSNMNQRYNTLAKNITV